MKNKNHPLIGQVVGAYKLNATHEHHDASFETASWWEKSQLEPGIYPIIVGINTYGRDSPLTLRAEGEGVITDSFFPSSFGGVMIAGQSPKKYIGQKKKVKIAIGWKEALDQTGNSQSRNEKPDVWINPERFPEIQAYFEEQLSVTLDTFDRMRTNPTDLESVRMLKHLSSWLAEDAENLERILAKTKNPKTEYMAKLINQNTQWAKSA